MMLLAALVLALLALLALYQRGGAFRYYTRFSAFVLLSLVAAAAPLPLMLLRPRDSRNALLPAWGARQVSRLLGLRWRVHGLQNAVRGSGSVVLINHQSALDLFVLAELWPRLPRCCVVAKREVFWLWPFGLAAWLWGTVFIDRLHAERARATVDATANAVAARHARLLLFPEGTRGDGAELLPFKKGAFHVAVAAQLPLQPVVVSRYHFLDAHAKRFSSGNSVISMLPAIPTAGLGRDDVDALVAHARDVMAREFTRISRPLLAEQAPEQDPEQEASPGNLPHH